MEDKIHQNDFFWWRHSLLIFFYKLRWRYVYSKFIYSNKSQALIFFSSLTCVLFYFKSDTVYNMSPSKKNSFLMCAYLDTSRVRKKIRWKSYFSLLIYTLTCEFSLRRRTTWKDFLFVNFKYQLLSYVSFYSRHLLQWIFFKNSIGRAFQEFLFVVVFNLL